MNENPKPLQVRIMTGAPEAEGWVSLNVVTQDIKNLDAFMEKACAFDLVPMGCDCENEKGEKGKNKDVTVSHAWSWT